MPIKLSKETQNKIAEYNEYIRFVFFPEDKANMSISKFVKRTKEASECYGNLLSEEKLLIEEKIKDKINTFKGDMFEILSELLFSNNHLPNYSIMEYEGVPLSNDRGTDATGINVNGDRCAIQCKFLSNPTKEVKYAPIARTDCSARRLHGVDTSKPKTIWLITTGVGANYQCNFLGESLVVINRNILSKYLDNQENFWIGVKETLLHYLNE